MDEKQQVNPIINSSEPGPVTTEHAGHDWRKKFQPSIIFLIGVIVLVGVFRTGYNFGAKGYTFDAKNFKVINKTGENVTVDYDLLWEALDIVQKKYIDRDQIDQKKVLYGAIQGAIKAAGDDYTEFFDPETLAQFRTELQGSFSGIGAEIGKREGNIVIVAPIEGSPAERAGLRAKDVIVKVNGQSTLDWSTDKAVSQIRGEPGTEVTLSVYREGKTSTFDVKIVRETIELKSVKVKYQEVGGKTVAIITLSRFGDDTKRLFDSAVNEIKGKNVAGLVVDVRNNPGGYLETAVDLSSDWLTKGALVVSEEHSEREVIKYNSTGINRLGNIKTVVLMNGGSASASEILAGALKDNGKATLIGEKSFGKGSVQELVPLSSDTAVKVTVAKWITPGGKNLNHDGLVPDIEVKLSDQDIEAQKDPQLDRAVQEIVK